MPRPHDYSADFRDPSLDLRPDPPDPRDWEETEEDRERMYAAWPLTDSDDDSIPF